MPQTAFHTADSSLADELELATFYVGDALMGVSIHEVEEINRLVDITPVPHAPEYVRGVINLRGEVVTMVDLRVILGLEPTDFTRETRNLVVRSRGERIGMLVDRIADVVRTPRSEICTPPANVAGADGRFFRGVCKLDNELLIIVDVEQVLAADSPAA